MLIRYFIISLIAISSLLANDITSLNKEVIQLRNEKQFSEAGELLVNFAGSSGDTALCQSLYYNGACLFSLDNNIKSAITYLAKSSDYGFYNIDLLENDTDLNNIRELPEYAEIKGKVQGNLNSLLSTLPEKHNSGELIQLPEPKKDSGYSLEKAMQNRRSIRSYKPDALTKEQLSQILWAAYGITYPIEDAPEFLRGGFKTAPSAGGLYPLDIYAVCENIEGISPGIYKYIPESHSLMLLQKGNLRQSIFNASYGQAMLNEAPLLLVYSAIYERTTSKYGNRGKERYVCMDLGHSGQNIYLQATALGLGTCAIGAFSDLDIKLAVGMTRAETPLYIMPVGWEKE